MSYRATWATLRPVERRFLIGVAVLLFIVANLVWVWPRFGDWAQTQTRLEKARRTLAVFQKEVDGMNRYKKLISELEKEGGAVSQEDQQNQFLRVVQSQAMQSGVNIITSSKQQTRTNEFFLELIQTFSVQSREKQLVNFLYNLGSGDSMVRVRDLSLRPDASHQQLGSNLKLVASYQKKASAKQTKAAAAQTPAPAAKTTPAPAKTATSAPKSNPAAAPKTDKKPVTTKKS